MEKRCSTADFAAAATSGPLLRTEFSRGPEINEPSTCPESQWSTNVGFPSGHKSRTPWAHETEDSDAPLNGNLTALKNWIHGSTVVLGTTAIVTVMVFEFGLTSSCVKSQ